MYHTFVVPLRRNSALLFAGQRPTAKRPQQIKHSSIKTRKKTNEKNSSSESSHHTATSSTMAAAVLAKPA
jgi:hypothetical protein